MAIDARKALATEFEPPVVTAERGRLAFFARATGQRDPVYADLDAAGAAGHPDRPIPPTFYFSLELERPDPLGRLTALGADMRRMLHGEQSYVHHAMACAGDILTLRSRVADVTAKRGGTLELVTKETLDAARAPGAGDVFAHGMLSMAYLGRLLTSWVPQEGLRSRRVRFAAITPVHAQPTCADRVLSVTDGLAEVELEVTLPDGTVILTGDAVIDLT